MSSKEVVGNVLERYPELGDDDKEFLLRAYECYGLHLTPEQEQVIRDSPSPWTLIREKYAVKASRRLGGRE